jgi:hypothetical protein
MSQGFYIADQGKGLPSPAPSPGPHPRSGRTNQLLLENLKGFGTYNGGRSQRRVEPLLHVDCGVGRKFCLADPIPIQLDQGRLAIKKYRNDNSLCKIFDHNGLESLQRTTVNRYAFPCS